MRHPVFFLSLLIPLAATFALGQSPNTERGFSANRVYQHTGLDSVNLFNGNVVIRIPLGAEYRVGGQISYRFQLAYNVNSWDYAQREVERGDPECPTIEGTLPCKFAYTYPSLDQNAGMGWLFSLGRMKDLKTYQSPDGTEHRFENKLHELDYEDEAPFNPGYNGPQTWMYTRDGSYLRLEVIADGRREVHFPNGVIHTFRDSDGYLERIDDLHGNWVTVTYDLVNPYPTWTIRDSQGRRHGAQFQPDFYYGHVLWRVDLEGFGGTAGSYDQKDGTFVLGYGGATIDRRCVTGAQWDEVAAPETVGINFLTSIQLPDGSQYVPGQYLAPATGSCTNEPTGAIGRLTLPTGGAAAWNWTGLSFPEGSGDSAFFRNVHGVTRRRLLAVNDSLIAEWNYTPQSTFGLEYPQFINTVAHPDGSTSAHYFSFCTEQTSCVGGSSDEYGLPFTKKTSDDNLYLASGGPYLSTVVSRGGQKLRSTFLRYEGDGGTAGGTVSICDTTYGPFRPVGWGTSQPVQRRVVYHDDGNKYAEEISWDFDGHGRYRRSALCGTFGSGDRRTSFTNYNPDRGPFGQTGYTQVPAGANWILGTHTESSTTENGQTLRSDSCFDTSGLLKGRRGRRDSAIAGDSDIVTLFSYTGNGNLEREQWFGGDDNSAAGISDLCAARTGGMYSITHGYQWGSLASSQHSGVNFKNLDLTIDQSTGLASASRDSSGVTTTYAYDTSGRITEVASAGSATSTYAYRKRGQMPGTTQAGVEIDHTPVAGELLPDADVVFDDLGRVSLERQRAADGSTVSRETRWHPMGWKERVSELEAVPQKFTVFSNFDPFGRPGTITPPDLKETTLAYIGVREVARTVKIGAALTPSTTRERYDRQGRLLEVTEPNSVVTTYGYDAANRLTSVTGPGSGPARTFTYDGRGFLVSENHPAESGVLNYFNYDARGHAREIRHPAASTFDLNFTFDSAERLTFVSSVNPARVIKELVHDGPSQVTLNGETVNSLGLGKLWKGIRHNYQGATDVKVTEELYYGDIAGRLTHKKTTIEEGATTLQSLTQKVGYDVLGGMKNLWYPQCTGAAGCGVSTLPNSLVTNQYQYGALTAVSPFINSVTYLPNGMFSTIQHANGVTVTQTQDISGMSRPGQISATGEAGSCVASVSSDRWKGEYFNNLSLSGAPALVRNDGSGNLLFNWGSGGPNTCGIGSDQFSVRWTRTVNFTAGTWRFTTATDDGVRLYVDGVLRIDKWIDQGTTTYTTDVTLTAGNHVIVMEFYENAGGAYASLSWAAVTSTLAAPTNLVATAGSATQVNLTWGASSGATSYQIERRAAGVGFTFQQSVTGTSYSDTAVVANQSYVYRVRAAEGSNVSAYSNADLATTIIYTNDPLSVGSVVLAAHFEQLRTAVNAVRSTAGLGAAAWTSLSPLATKVIKRIDLIELRDRLGEARTSLGLASGAYTIDPTITAAVTTIKTAHVQELRERTR